jgi:hypothetical protein
MMQNKQSYMPLQGQAKPGKWVLVNSAGSRTNARDEIGQKPLHAPAREGDSDVVGLPLIKVVSKDCQNHTIGRCGAKWQSQRGRQ